MVCPSLYKHAHSFPKNTTYDFVYLCRIPNSPALHQLAHLFELHLYESYESYEYYEYYDNDISDLESLTVILDNSLASLRRLSIPSRVAAAMPIRTFTELNIYVTRGMLELSGVLRHATCLTELGLIGYVKPRMLTNLQSSSGALPCLTSFRLHVDHRVESRYNIAGLLDFLRGRESVLRRLDLLLNTGREASEALTQTIERLYALEVLGLDMGVSLMDTETLANSLPLNLRSLNLTLCEYHNTELKRLAHDNPYAPLVNLLPYHPFALLTGFCRIEQMPFLSCLVLNDLQEELPLQPIDIVAASKHIELLGLNSQMWNVVTSSQEGICNFFLEQWSKDKMSYKVPGDFSNIDDGWLLGSYVR